MAQRPADKTAHNRKPGSGDKISGPDPASNGASNIGQPYKNRPTSKEIGGPSGPEPTRYGDWEKKGRCIDF